ncbi:multidrug resistance-associated protein 1-like isoform X1 [Biomphalaria glabrata]|uniref:ABC-type glutathione-S-conjugate transporter n=1 Tax=Biomphalaria glabrata TaxID=6526 RepID=A0A9W3B357_BIOGL|nr:multidrug resistance-associated protein 1-like isoform X1 [Biomphalaria glabrata]XP_055893891.1 multidrug resistance-associated protein 1-like isoform X1 [Biomphalaria glabrata]
MDYAFEPLCGNHSIWNSDLLINNTWPEFTQCFQWTILQWTPCLWMWITFPVHLWYIRHRHPVELYTAPSSKLYITKMLICLLLIVLPLLNIFITIQDEQNSTPPVNALYLSYSIQSTTYILVAILSSYSRKAGLQSPCVLFIFWTLDVACNIVPIYSYILLDLTAKESTQFYILCTSYVLILIQWILHFVSDRILPQFDVTATRKVSSPENTASFPSKITFHWMSSYIWKGYRHYLKPEDIWDLPEHFKSQQVVPSFLEAWEKEKWKQYLGNRQLVSSSSESSGSEDLTLLSEHVKPKENPTDKSSLLKVLFLTYAPELLRAHLFRLAADLIQFLLPLLTRSLINYVQKKETHTVWQAYALVTCFFVVSFIHSLLFNQNSYRGSCVGMKVKTGLISAVYRKSLSMSNETKKKFTVGTIVNLMSLDCQVLQDVTSNLYLLVSTPVQIGVAFYFLNNALGVSFVAGVAVIVALIPLNAKVSLLAKRAQSEQLTVKDERLRTMNEMLNGIKVLKLYAWETTFEQQIQSLRHREVQLLRTVAILNVISVFSWLCSPVLVTTITFITYIYRSSPHSLDANTAFVSLILFNILSVPMHKLPNIISDLISAHVSIKRLKDFLCSENLSQNRSGRENRKDRMFYEGQFKQIRTRNETYAIAISSGTFRWDRSSQPVLKSINLNIPQGKLVALVGHIGSGKSSLLSALLGEMDKVCGDVLVKGQIAYLPQQAWIQNKSIKQNILFGRQYHQHHYNKVIKGCALHTDLEHFIGGDKAEVGENGINLSGGQKQRVSLARTVYGESDVLLLDDPLSSLDMHVGKHIFKNVISNSGLLKTKTRLLVTHGVHWLPMVDFILVLQHGQIIQSGTYENLIARDGPFAQLLKSYLLNEDIEDDPEINYIRSEMWRKVDSVTSDGLTSAEEDERPRRRRVLRRATRDSMTDSSTTEDRQARDSNLNGLTEGLIEEEQCAKGKIKGAVICEFIRAYGVIYAVFLVVSLILYQSVSAAASVWLSTWTDDPYLLNLTLSTTDLYESKTWTYLAVYSSLGFVQAICALGFIGNISLRMVAAARRLHNKLLNNIMRQPMNFFENTPHGRIINRFSRDVEMIDNSMSRLVRTFSQHLFIVISVLVIISYTTPVFIAAACPVMLIYYLIQKLYVPTSRQLRRNESITKSPIYSHFSETLRGAHVIRAFNVGERFILESQYKVDVNNAYLYASTSASRWLRIRLELLGNFIVTTAAFLAVVTDGLTGSLVGLSISHALQITTALNELVQNSTQLESNVVSVERIVEYSKLPQESPWVLPFQELSPDWPTSGEIVFESYCCRHRPDLDLVLDHISCHIESGDKIGIVGKTGAGKSSLSMALFRMIESESGSILIDGVNIAAVGLQTLRSKLTIIPQDPVVFSGTLRFNVDPYTYYSDEDIWATLSFARLTSFVSNLPGGLYFTCEENGQNLSLGQRQLVCLIRCVLRHNKIIVLDEATAAVDLETDELIQQTIRLCFRECTVLTIAHRLTTVMDYDRIMVLENGRLLEFDTVESLKDNPNSIFYRMVKEAGLVF